MSLSGDFSELQISLAIRNVNEYLNIMLFYEIEFLRLFDSVICTTKAKTLLHTEIHCDVCDFSDNLEHCRFIHWRV